jgi:hypothetical protein
MTEENAPTSLAISMTMRIRWYGAERITQYGRSRATLDVPGRHHRVSIHPVSPRWTPWSSILAKKMSCGVVEITLSKGT